MFYQTPSDLFGWQDRVDAFDAIDPWMPRSLLHHEWPPNYPAVYAWRIKTLSMFDNSPDMLQGAKDYYATHPAEFIMHWMDTYDPRKHGTKWMPFVFFERQREFIDFLHGLRVDGENGLVEKCRDAGATWLACGYSIWSFLFIKADAIGWGSRKQELVDKLGDVSSIFEKMRKILERLPPCFMPKYWAPTKHAVRMKLLNPDNGSTITGEIGDAIGRGGRTAMYFKDESAHYERPELIEASLGDNTNVQVDISSVNGLGNVFHRRREAGVEWEPNRTYERGETRVFIIDWSHHPEKDQDWYDRRKNKAEREGLLHLFAQEVERNYSAAIQNTIIPYEWIEAAVDAHLKIPALMRDPAVIPDDWMAALDVADEGADKNACAVRQWRILRHVENWGARDVAVTARNTVGIVKQFARMPVNYDSAGLGAGVKGEYNNLVENPEADVKGIEFISWNPGAGVVEPYAHLIPGDTQMPLNIDHFENLKAQAWWSLRTCFYKTWRSVTTGEVYDAEELISIDSDIQDLLSLKKELAQPTIARSKNLKMLIEKRPDGMKSPDRADAVVMAYFPLPDVTPHAILGKYGG